MELQELHKEILAMCADDYTELWYVIRLVYPSLSSENPIPDWVNNKALEPIRQMLESGYIEAGNLYESFSSLKLSPAETISYIKNAWEKLEGKSLRVGYICWFRATPTGEQLARELNLI
jgi:hypothetical protein